MNWFLSYLLSLIHPIFLSGFLLILSLGFRKRFFLIFKILLIFFLSFFFLHFNIGFCSSQTTQLLVLYRPPHLQMLLHVVIPKWVNTFCYKNDSQKSNFLHKLFLLHPLNKLSPELENFWLEGLGSKMKT